jgi:uncharacterized protein YdhG (YjbR/CyaY superfamily)
MRVHLECQGESTHSFFNASPKLAAAMEAEIAKTHKISGATIHFSPDKPLPTALVKKILRERLRENAALGTTKSPGAAS